MATVEAEAQRLGAALGRAIDHTVASWALPTSHHVPQRYRHQHHLLQRCPLCLAVLGVWIETGTDNEVDVTSLHRQLFSLYDAHRCVDHTEPFTVFERAERALVTAAERIGAISDPELRARAEAEADRMATLAKELGDRLRA